MSHDCASHRPGVRACYVSHKCRCAECTEANRIYYHQWNRERLEREHGARSSKYVPADQPRRTLAAIRETGTGLRTISTRTGIARSTLFKIANRNTDRVLRTTARQLAAVYRDTVVNP